MPAAPVAARLGPWDRPLPPILAMTGLVKGRSAPIARGDAGHVFPMFNTSGPCPGAVAARIRLNRLREDSQWPGSGAAGPFLRMRTVFFGKMIGAPYQEHALCRKLRHDLFHSLI